MARRIKSKKSKHLGNRTYGGGNTKNRRGKGNKGGKGNAGFHKHNWLRTIKRGEHKNRKYGFHSLRSRMSTVTLEQISTMIDLGKCEKEGSAYKVSLGYAKVVGTGAITSAANVHAGAFSKGAKEKIEAAGGHAVSPEARKKAKRGHAGAEAALAKGAAKA